MYKESNDMKENKNIINLINKVANDSNVKTDYTALDLT